MFKYGIIGILLLLLPGSIPDSENRSFELSRNNSTILITGTSTLHNWKMDLKVFDVSARFILDGYRLRGIDDVTFRCKSEDLKSDYSLMDKKAYFALKSDTFPEIKFRMTSPMDISTDNDKFSDILKGTLYIAGQSKSVSIPFNGTLHSKNGTYMIDVSGQTELKMSDFDISPPVFMMGVLKTGDMITITLSIQLLHRPVN